MQFSNSQDEHSTVKLGLCLPTSCSEADVRTFLSFKAVADLLPVNISVGTVSNLDGQNRSFFSDPRNLVAL